MILQVIIGASHSPSVLVQLKNFRSTSFVLFIILCAFIHYNVFAIFNLSTNFQLLLNVLNNHHPNLRFTCEEVSDLSLPFFDVELTICDGKFNVNVYRKPTFTGVLVHFKA